LLCFFFHHHHHMAAEATPEEAPPTSTAPFKQQALEALQRDCETFAAMARRSEAIDTQMAAVAASIDTVVARLAEFAAFAEMVRAERDAGSALAPQLAERARSLEGAFVAVDAMTELVRRMTAAVAELEERAEAVEKFLGAHARKSLWKSIPVLRNNRVAEPELPEWKPVAIPRAEPVLQELARARPSVSAPPQHP